jgi:hypothetical protein
MTRITYDRIYHPKYKYYLLEDFTVPLGGFWEEYDYEDDYVKLRNQQLTAKEGYAWNGLTCFPDAKRWLSASVPHDLLLGENGQKIGVLAYDNDTYEEIHKVFYEELLRSTRKIEADVLYLGVKTFHPITMRFND